MPIVCQLKLYRLPLINHLVQLRLKLALLCCNRANFYDIINNLHDTHFLELVEALHELWIDHNLMILLNDLIVPYLEVWVLERA